MKNILIQSKKKINFIIFCVVIVAIIAVLIITHKDSVMFLINHEDWLTQPNSVEVIYMYDFRKGTDFQIWTYDDSRFKKLISKKRVKQIFGGESIDVVRIRIEEYYSSLHDTEKELFDKYVNIDKIITKENYYYYKGDPYKYDTFVLVIIDVHNQKLYYFNKVG